MNEIQIGIIGTGGRGAHATLAHRPEQGFVIAAGADPSERAREQFREKFPNTTLYADYRELLSDRSISVVFIMTPDFLHEEMAIAALEAGKAVYLEKPLAITLDGCDRVLAAAMRTRSKLFVGHNMRYYPVVLKMKEIIDSGLIGDVQCGWCRHFVGYGGDAYFRDWHSERRNTGGLLLQKGSHDIDVMHFLMGGYTQRVTGMGMLSVYNRCARRDPALPGSARWDADQYPPLGQGGFSPVIDVEDHNMILMQLDNGSQASYLQCHYSPDAERNYTFIGTRGRVENIGDNDHCQIHVWTRRGPRATPDIVYHLKPAAGGHGGSDDPIITDFLQFVREGKTPCVSPVAARNAVAAGILGHDSMRNGNMPQTVPPLPPELLQYFDNGQQ